MKGYELEVSWAGFSHLSSILCCGSRVIKGFTKKEPTRDSYSFAEAIHGIVGLKQKGNPIRPWDCPVA